MQDLGREHEHEGRHQCKDQGGHANHADADRRQAPFPPQCIDKRAARNLTDDAGKGANGKRKPDLAFGPAKIREVKGNEGSESGLDIGQEEIHPVQPLPALPRDGRALEFAGPAIARERSVKPA